VKPFAGIIMGKAVVIESNGSKGIDETDYLLTVISNEY
jgi:hypothetical protein